jgi:beta-phosphoglucomutase-like phosphatase (HAD superfamily)
MLDGSPAFTAVVFDMDGLLLDSERPTRDAWLHAATALGVPLTEAEYLSVVGLNHIDSHLRLLTLFGGDAALLASAGARADVALAGGPPFDAKPGARRLLNALREARIPCAVASSTHHAEVRRRLQRAGLLDHFSVVCGGDEVQRGKPAPDLYALALARLNVAPRTAVAFEDSGHGVQAALAAGLATVAIPDLKAPAPEWLARCHAVLPSLDAACERSPDWFGVICAQEAEPPAGVA